MKSKVGAEHKSQLNRLKRIEGQVRGLINMVEGHRYCIDILTQIKAIKSALASVEANVVEEHLSHCVTRAVQSKSQNETKEIISEIRDLLKKTVK